MYIYLDNPKTPALKEYNPEILPTDENAQFILDLTIKTIS